MQNKINPVAKTFGILLSILFVVSATLTILIFNLFNKSFDPGLYKQAIDKAGFYNQLPLLIGEQINYQAIQDPCLENPTDCSTPDEEGITSKLPLLSADQWATILTPLIDPAWLKVQTESVIDQVFHFLTEPGEPLSIDISLVELKANLSGDKGYRAALQLIKNLPRCTSEDLLKLPLSLLNPSEELTLPLCQPSEEILNQLEEPLRNLLSGFADTLPDNTGSLFTGMGNSLTSNLTEALQRLQLIRAIAQLTPIVPIFTLLLITLLVVRSFKGFLRWWGILMLITGFLGLTLALMISPLVKSFVLVRFSLEGLAPGMISMIKLLLMNATHSIEETLVLQNVILGMGGIVMVVVSTVLKPKTT